MPRYTKNGDLVFYTRANPVADNAAIGFAREIGQRDAAYMEEPDLSGEWADRMTGPDLVNACLFEAGYQPGSDAHDDAYERLFMEICYAYEEAWNA